jgi:hypothetical protein
MSVSWNVITYAIQSELEIWKRAFVERWATQPPEFFLYAGAGARDMYVMDIGELTNPLRCPFFDALLRSASLDDLDAIQYALGPVGSGNYMGYLEFFQEELLQAAKKADERLLTHASETQLSRSDKPDSRPVDSTEEGMYFSWDIPRWFRFKGWRLGDKWNCEK